jgi:hypothetical protein
VIRLTVVSSHSEADAVCSLLRARGIGCSDRAADPSNGEWRTIFVADEDLGVALELLAIHD